MRLARIVAGRRAPDGLVGAILTADIVVGGRRWSKGRRLSEADLDEYGTELTAGGATVLLLDPGELHEDDAALQLAFAVAGEGLETRGPVQSRVDLRATHDGVLHVRVGTLERVNRLDPLEVFTEFDGSVVEAGDLVASVKIAPHVVAECVVEAAIARLGRRAGRSSGSTRSGRCASRRSSRSRSAHLIATGSSGASATRWRGWARR